LARGLAARESTGTTHVLDVDYADLITSPSAVIQQIVDRTGLEPDEAWLRSVPTAATIKQKDRTGNHPYALSQFGLAADQISERFATYIDSYDWG
jgi:hypothetical protein